MRPGAVLDQHARGPLVDETGAARMPSTRARSPPRASTSSRASRSKTSGCAASQYSVHAAHGVLQRRRLHRAAHQDRRGSQADPAGRTAAEPGEFAVCTGICRSSSCTLENTAINWLSLAPGRDPDRPIVDWPSRRPRRIGAVSRVAQRLVVGPGLLQPVVLVADRRAMGRLPSVRSRRTPRKGRRSGR